MTEEKKNVKVEDKKIADVKKAEPEKAEIGACIAVWVSPTFHA